MQFSSSAFLCACPRDSVWRKSVRFFRRQPLVTPSFVDIFFVTPHLVWLLFATLTFVGYVLDSVLNVFFSFRRLLQWVVPFLFRRRLLRRWFAFVVYSSSSYPPPGCFSSGFFLSRLSSSVVFFFFFQSFLFIFNAFVWLRKGTVSRPARTRPMDFPGRRERLPPQLRFHILPSFAWWLPFIFFPPLWRNWVFGAWKRISLRVLGR